MGNLIGIVFGALGLLFMALSTLWALSWLVRALLSALGLGRCACSMGWHWRRSFEMHVSHELTRIKTTYLAVAGQRIRQCRTCGAITPEQGAAVLEQWKRGGIKVRSSWGVFSTPVITADDEAAKAISEAASGTATRISGTSPVPQDARRTGEPVPHEDRYDRFSSLGTSAQDKAGPKKR